MNDLRYIFILGSHPQLSAAEVWHVLNQEGYEPQFNYGDQKGLDVTLAHALKESTWMRLGGSERVVTVWSEMKPISETAEIVTEVMPHLNGPEKIVLGISLINNKTEEAARLGNALKKSMRAKGQKLQFIVPRKGLHLNAAQVIFNNLLRPENGELWVWNQPDKIVLGRTQYVQDIEKYALRDTERPVRDAVVGMLPPKIAQIMLNLAYGDQPTAEVEILDPFCGMGTLLQEGWLTGFKMTGMDISGRMTAATEDNLDWIGDKLLLSRAIRPVVSQQDATLPWPEEWHNKFAALVTEPDLGRPLRSPLPYREFNRHIRPLIDLYTKVLENAMKCLKPQGTVVISLPAFRTRRGSDNFYTLPEAFLDQISRLGYSEEHLLPEPLKRLYQGNHESTLIYARPSALVGREIRRWRKK